MNDVELLIAQKRELKQSVVILWAALLCAIAAFAPNTVAQIEVTASIDTTAGYIGDRFTYELELIYYKNDSLVLPPQGINLHAFRILDYTAESQESPDGTRVQRSCYRITTFSPGVYVIPPLPIRYWTAAGDSGELITNSLTIEIHSLGVTPADSLRGLKPLETVPLQIRAWVLYSLIVVCLLVVLIVISGVYLAKKQRNSGVKKRSVTINEIAEFDRIILDEYIAHDDIAGFYDAVSDQLRVYFSRRYVIPAVEMTVDEVRVALIHTTMRKDDADAVHLFLARCDLVKFAKVQPDEEETNTLISRAKDIVRNTQADPLIDTPSPQENNVADETMEVDR